MSDALERQLEYRRAAGGPFVAAWFPLLRSLGEPLLDGLVQSPPAGADLVVVELPTMDGLFFDAAGEVLCRAAEDALGLAESLDRLAEVRGEIDAPVALWSHLAPLLEAGVERVGEQALASGVDVACCIDLPSGAGRRTVESFRGAGLSMMAGIAAATDRKRLATIEAENDGLLWCQDPLDLDGPDGKSELRDLKRLNRRARSLVLADTEQPPTGKLARRLAGVVFRRVGALALSGSAALGEAMLGAIRGARGDQA